MFSKSWGYAVHALVRLAKFHDDPKARSLANELAEQTGMPGSFLSKVLKQLTDAGLVDSVRGRNGGIRLARDPDTITLYDVAKVTGDFNAEEIVVPGFEDASEEMIDALKPLWLPYHRSILEFLAEINISTLARNIKEE